MPWTAEIFALKLYIKAWCLSKSTVTQAVECSEKGVEPADHSPQTENNVKKSYELNSKRINHCYICKPKVECTYVSCYERHL